jgi:two-component system response regulator FixJ
MIPPLRIALVDDDEAVLDSLSLYLRRKGLEPVGFRSAEALLACGDDIASFACLFVDVRMTGMSGLDLVQRLAADRRLIPTVLITGHGDIDMAVNAIRLGARDFVEKPFDEARLLDSILAAAGEGERRRHASEKRSELRTRYNNLSDRQREVMELAVKGRSNKQIGQQLGISPRTVEIHRAWMMSRMGAQNLAELIRMQIDIGTSHEGFHEKKETSS